MPLALVVGDSFVQVKEETLAVQQALVNVCVHVYVAVVQIFTGISIVNASYCGNVGGNWCLYLALLRRGLFTFHNDISLLLGKFFVVAGGAATIVENQLSKYIFDTCGITRR